MVMGVVTALFVLNGCSNSGASTAAPGGGKGGKKGMAGDAPVTVAVAATKDVPVEIQVIGNVEAYSTISLKAQVTGQITQSSFNEGDYVKKNDLLFTIDRRPLEAALNQVIANEAHDEASLSQAQANQAKDSAQAKYADSQATAYAQLFKDKVVSRDQADQLRANADAAKQLVAADQAAIESARAAIGSSKAAVENARVQLGYTEIRSPIDGRTGNVAVKQGNIVMANSQELCTINQIEPAYVTFSVPEAQLGAIKQYMAERKLPVRARPQDDSNAGEESGTLTFVDNAVDMTTGTIKLKGTFANTDRKLWPGQFVRVTLRLATQANAVTVPNEAVMTGQNGSYVYVVKADRSVENRAVTTGSRVNQDMVIEKGLEAGETVVREGQLRLAPGSKVVIGGRGAKGSGPGAGAAAAPDATPANGKGTGPGGRKGRPQN
jgi:membrane fusion protein, multidrug efflux system